MQSSVVARKVNQFSLSSVSLLLRGNPTLLQVNPQFTPGVGHVSTPTVGSAVECLVSETTPLGLIVSVPWWAGFGRVDITDVADEYTEDPLEVFREMREGVRCCVVRVCGDQMDLSLRPSRVSAHPVGDSPDREITSLEELPEGSIVRGYVKAVTAVGVFVR